MFYSRIHKNPGQPPSHAEWVFKVGAELNGWAVIICLFAPMAAALSTAFFASSGDLSYIAAFAAEHHGLLVAALLALGAFTIVGFFLMNAAFEAWDAAELEAGSEDESR